MPLSVLSGIVKIGAHYGRAPAGASATSPIRTTSFFGHAYACALERGGGGRDPSAESHVVDKPVLIDEHELRQGLEHQPGDLVLEQEHVLLMLGLWIASSGSAAPPQRLAVHHVLQQEAVVGAM